MKGSNDGVRGSVAALGDSAVRAAAGRGDDIHTRSGVEGLAPITGELRETIRSLAIDDSVLTIGGDDFHRLCDAIDAVHAALERENEELRESVAVLDNRRGNMHDGWVRLPLDADGVPIRVGDEVVDELDESTAPRKVTSLYLANDGWWVYIGSIGRRPSRYSHHHAPTVEDVLWEMLKRWGDAPWGSADDDEEALVAEFATKLRLAEGEDA